jgi:hypothetical protein
VLPSGGALLFCAHHAREHEAALRAIAVEVQDETGQIEAPTTAPDDER